MVAMVGDIYGNREMGQWQQTAEIKTTDIKGEEQTADTPHDISYTTYAFILPRSIWICQYGY